MKKTLLFCVLLFVVRHSSLAQIVVETVSNTSCSIPNGSASASVGGTTTGYTFEWRVGVDESNPVFFTGAVAVNLSAGTYSVSVTDQSTSSVIGTAQAMVIDAVMLFEISIQSTANTQCSGGSNNGSLTVTINGVSGGDGYSFEWYAGTEVSGTALSNSQVFNNVGSGNYTVKVTNLTTGCTAIATAQVADDCQVSLPGFSSYANQVVTNQKKNESPIISYYPNPVSTTFFILSQVNASVSLIDREGNVIMQQAVSPSTIPFTLNVSDVKPGKYILRVQEGGTTTSYQVIVKR